MYINFSKVVIELVLITQSVIFDFLSIISLATLIICVQFSLCTKMCKAIKRE